jgi:Cell wall-active antibiotics response 4TMS YvqF
VVFRIVFVVLTFTGGAGILLYIVAAVLLPGDHGEPPPINDALRYVERGRPHRWLGIVLVVVALAILIDNSHGVGVSIFWGLALIALGVLLFQHDRAPWEWTPTPAGTGAGAGAAEAGLEGGGAAGGGAEPASTGESTAAASWATPSWGGGPSHGERYRGYRRARVDPGPPVGWITVALSLVAVGVAVMLSNAGAISLTVGSALAIVLAVLGAGLVVTAFVGRGRFVLILFGVLLLPFVATASLVDEPLGGGTGDQSFLPQSAQQVKPQYDIAAGRLTLDLSAAHLGSAPTHVRASVAFGDLVVWVPRDLPVTVHAHIGGGRIEALGRTDQGMQISDDISAPGTTTENALSLDLGVGFGDIHVQRSDAPSGVPQ